MDKDLDGALSKLLVKVSETHTTVKQIDERTRKHDDSLYGTASTPGVVLQLDRLIRKEKARQERIESCRKKKWTLVATIWGAIIGFVGTTIKKIWDHY